MCGEANACQLCAVATHKGPCWCVRVEIPGELLARVPESLHNRVCLCQNCVNAFNRERDLGRLAPPATGGAKAFSLIELLVGKQVKSLLSEAIKAGEISIDSPSNEMLARTVICVGWIPENILRQLGTRAAQIHVRDTSLRGVVAR